MNRRSIAAIAIGLVFSLSAVYWFTIGRRPLELAPDVDVAEEPAT